MRRLVRTLLLGVAIAGWTAPAGLGQSRDAPATLIADRVDFDSRERNLVASGNVEILQEDTRLTASRITYDGQADRIVVEGPITLQDGERTVILADMAELSADLKNGILTSARMVFDRQLQIAAAEVERVETGYTQMRRSVASSCKICNSSDTPIWQIRARTVTHDEEKRKLYFENATLEVFGLPVAWAPRLSLPDPTVKRASGFLVPEFRTTDNLGSGVKLPYFITLGDHADLTVAPYVTTNDSQTLELRYRQRFARGELDFQSAITEDELTEDQLRGYFFAQGRFEMPRDFTLNVDIELVSDPGYLLEYGYSDKDRLDSSVQLTRTRRDEHIEGEVIAFRSLRDDESNRSIPSWVVQSEYTRRFSPAGIGGTASVTAQTLGYFRTADDDGPDSRDALRASARGDWRRNWILPGGVVFSSLAALNLDFYGIQQDSAFDSSEARVTPFLGAELRWPLIKGGTHASHVIEPVAQLVWSREDGTTLPNEDSRLVEFDETNLFSLSRFSGADAVERGLRANLGLSYTRRDPQGWSMTLAAGRVIREENLGQFTAATGLSGTTSDWVSAVHFAVSPGLSLVHRAVFDDDLDFAKAEARLGWTTEDLELASSYVWLRADPAESRPEDLSEIYVDAGYQLTDQWRARANWRYDIVADDTTRAGFGVTYQNECIAVDLSLSRRFTSSTNVTPSTDFGLTVSLTGFGDRGDGASRAHKCRG
ncbi:LPS-assembly protein LptD [Maritimibacter sp. 55A14]|uniref:LPS-assembly protein LptD n=1 Tax=Maritimibacter sp. 55A14 TaxID=2174844 RepID=UPI000D610F70|nr:LPS assembly protein LptD [Maritimibacter sp. 55A14]PWE34166.1 LPS-assembly protein LptD [Maritimibacter sp. 55A14]